MAEEEALKKIKDGSAALHLKTKTTIEGVSDGEVIELLREKWVVPIVNSIRALPDGVLSEFLWASWTRCAGSTRQPLMTWRRKFPQRRNPSFPCWRSLDGQQVRYERAY